MTENIMSIPQGVNTMQYDLAAPVVNRADGGEFQPQAKGNTQKKVGRNAPCPCGSAKKYKKCHGLPQVSRLVEKPVKPNEYCKTTTPDGGTLAEMTVAELFMYTSKKHHEAMISLWRYLEDFIDGLDDLHERFSGTVYKVWFDFATHKLLDIRKVRSIPFKTGRLYFADEPPTHTPDLPENTVEFQDIITSNALDTAQFMFDDPENRKLLDECERDFKSRFVLLDIVLFDEPSVCRSFIKLSFLEGVADNPSCDHLKGVNAILFQDLTWEQVIANSTSRKDDYCQFLQITQEAKPRLLDIGLDPRSLTPKQRRGLEIYRERFIKGMNLGPETKAA